MIDRFEKLTTGVSRIYKNIQRIKKHEMSAFGLKGTHVMCIYYLASTPEGLTASDLCLKCNEDKAAVSRMLSELEAGGFISYENASVGKKYRTKAVLTEHGKGYAERISSLILRFTELCGEGISDEEREIFYRVLLLIADNIETMERKL